MSGLSASSPMVLGDARFCVPAYQRGIHHPFLLAKHHLAPATYLRFRQNRHPISVIASNNDGSPTQQNSAPTTRRPRSLKKRVPMGETWIGRNGKKNRSVDHGQNRATPFPPLVNASNKVCEVVEIQVATNTVHRGVRRRLASAMETNAQTNAATSECDAPRCPQGEPYGTRNTKPITSRSGKAADAQQIAVRRQFIRRAPAPTRNDRGTRMCPTAEGMVRPFASLRPIRGHRAGRCKIPQIRPEPASD